MVKDSYKDVYPPYLPAYYFLFLRLRKAMRQHQVRRTEERARKNGPRGIVLDEGGQWQRHASNRLDHINKSAFWMDEDLNRPEIRKIVESIESLKEDLKSKGLKYTATAASFVPRLYTEPREKKNSWENAWCFYHSGVKPGHRVLDIGGASTAFNFYLASLGCNVSIVDNDWNNCGIIYNANYVAKKMNWDLKAYDLDAEKPLPFESNSFDRIFSVCVIEHLTSKGRRTLMKELGRLLKPGGILSLTTDYDINREPLIFDKGLRFAYRRKIEEDLIKPSGLSIYGNTDLVDPYPEKDFLGALFLKKD